MQHMQREWYWIIALFMFFLEREAVVDIMVMILTIVLKTLD